MPSKVALWYSPPLRDVRHELDIVFEESGIVRTVHQFWKQALIDKLEIHQSNIRSTEMSSRITCGVGILTSSTTNPFAQGWDVSSPQEVPSVFGALPYPGSNALFSSDDSLTLFFSPLNPTILNCTVVSLQNQPFFHIRPDNEMLSHTLWENTSHRRIALVEWKAQPTVEIRDIVGKQRVKDWLRLSGDSDGSYRTMEVNKVQYVWITYHYSIRLYNPASPSQMLANATNTGTVVTLEITRQAIQLHLLEICIVATIILLSGNNID